MSTERKAVKHKPSSQASPGLLKRLPITAPPGCGLMTDHFNVLRKPGRPIADPHQPKVGRPKDIVSIIAPAVLVHASREKSIETKTRPKFNTWSTGDGLAKMTAAVAQCSACRIARCLRI
jgi:hypothetical protein